MLTATLLALGSASVHATWNLLIKTSTGDRRITTWGVFLLGGLLTLPVIAVVGLPGWVALPWLVMSGVVHMFYGEGLAAAYTHGDLSATYPVARGGGALLAAVGGVALLDDHLSVPAWIALGIVAVGLVSIRGRGGTAGLGWAAFTAVCIAVLHAHRLARRAGGRQRHPLRPGHHPLRGARRLDLEPRAAPRAGVAGRVAERVAALDHRWRLHRHRLHAGAGGGARSRRSAT